MAPAVPADVERCVTQLGFDLEGADVVDKGKQTIVRIVVDSESGVAADALAKISRQVEALLDETPGFAGDSNPYVLEVTTRGVDEPLTLERHWRRARGRRVEIRRDSDNGARDLLTGRIGHVHDGAVDIVVREKKSLSVVTVPLGEVVKAVVQVEFSSPDPREVQLAGADFKGRPVPGGEAISLEAADKSGIAEEINK